MHIITHTLAHYNDNIITVASCVPFENPLAEVTRPGAGTRRVH